MAGIAREGEGLDYAAVFLPETGARDTLATLNGIAGETERLLLGTGVIPMRNRISRLAAMAAATVQERSGGRHILGVGTGGSAPGALGRLGDYVMEIRDLVAGSAPGAELGLPLPAPVPIWMAALGPKAVRLAGEIADGVILNWCPPERVAEARDAIRGAAGEAGRDPDSSRSPCTSARPSRDARTKACWPPPPSTPPTLRTPGSSRRWAWSPPRRRSWTPCVFEANRIGRASASTHIAKPERTSRSSTRSWLRVRGKRPR